MYESEICSTLLPATRAVVNAGATWRITTNYWKRRCFVRADSVVAFEAWTKSTTNVASVSR